MGTSAPRSSGKWKPSKSSGHRSATSTFLRLMKSRLSPSQTGEISEAEKFTFGTRVRLRAFDTRRLRAIIDARIARERQAWLQHLRTIERVGPRNVGILDTIHGKLYGAGAPFLIDEK